MATKNAVAKSEREYEPPVSGCVLAGRISLRRAIFWDRPGFFLTNPRRRIALPIEPTSAETALFLGLCVRLPRLSSWRVSAGVRGKKPLTVVFPGCYTPPAQPRYAREPRPVGEMESSRVPGQESERELARPVKGRVCRFPISIVLPAAGRRWF